MASVVLAADETYLPHIACNIAQLARFARSADSVVLAVPAGLEAEHVTEAQAAADIHGLQRDVVPVSELAALRSRRVIHGLGHISDFAYSKLVLAEILPHLDDVLYLDVDTLIRTPLDELLARELNHSLGAVIELGAGTHLFGTPRQPYFNTGVLRMSLERLRREQIWARAQAILDEQFMTVMEQDVFNVLFMDRFDSLPLTYNVFATVARDHRFKAVEDPSIVHFAGPDKPWHPSTVSPFAREWRQHSMVVSARVTQSAAWHSTAGVNAGPERLATYGRSRQAGRNALLSIGLAMLPATTKQRARNSVVSVFERSLFRVERMQMALLPEAVHYHTPPWGIPPITPDDSVARVPAGHNADQSQGLDLVISLPRSGTTALGTVLENTRPQTRWLAELYLGSPRKLRPGELGDTFPWFYTGGPNIHMRLPPERRPAAQRNFTAIMSEHAIDLTREVMKNSPGRTCIKIFPWQLHPVSFADLLVEFRPRLLFLRRDLVFSYISLLRAIRTNSFHDSDQTEVPFTANDRQAMHHALQADSWFDSVSRAATDLRLSSTWVIYHGLFETGQDIPVLESFYPGPPLPVGPSGGLFSEQTVQDRRTDTSILEMIKAVSGLSAATQHHLLRLPGSHP